MAVLEKMIEVKKFDIEGLVEFRPKVFKDERGYFFESFNEHFFNAQISELKFVQDNQSLSKKNVLRGLHFQKPPFDQGKLVRVVAGSVLDVALDIRKSSKTYGKCVSFLLSSELKNVFWIPPGFAHGFLALADNTIFSYKCTNLYNYESEDALLWNDEDLSIDWKVNQPLVSEKDQQAKPFKSFNSPFE